MSARSPETVYIVGAGASFPYGVPIGSELRKQIAKSKELFEWNHPSVESAGFNVLVQDFTPSEINIFFERFPNAPQESIDRFLATSNSGAEVEIGKICIAYNLLVAESKCTIDSRETQGHWLLYLFNHLNLTMHPERLDGIAFVSFNYDRLIERFFDQAFRYGLGATEAQYMPKIVRVHGSLGDYSRSNWDANIAHTIHASEIQRAARDIQIVHQTDACEEAKDLIGRAKRVVFLGFSYAEENMRKIWPASELDIAKGFTYPFSIFGSAFGLKAGEVRRIPYLPPTPERGKPKTILGKENEDCLMMLREYDCLPTYGLPTKPIVL